MVRLAAFRLPHTIALVLLVFVAGCAAKPAPAGTEAGRIEFLTRGECVNTPKMRANLDAALRAMNRPADYQLTDLDTLSQTDERTGYPTPAVLLDGVELFGLPRPTAPFPEPT